MSFRTLPVIDFKQAFHKESKPRFLQELRYALIEVGFFILVNFDQYGPSEQDFIDIEKQSAEFFALPTELKEDIAMVNSPHFLGYTAVGNEITGGIVDQREQIDLATELPAPSKELPIFNQLEGPNQWPSKEALPEFRKVVTNYIQKMTELSNYMKDLVEEAIGLPKHELDSFFKENQQYKMKLISYPEISEDYEHNNNEELNQGVGAHRDNTFMTFIYQCIEVDGSLQVENFEGQWIPVNKIPNSLVVNVGQLLESITNGVCKATIHRVVSPKKGSGRRLSIPFFQNVHTNAYQRTLANFPSEVIQLRDKRDKLITKWGINVGFQFEPELSKYPAGVSVFKNRIKSHQDVAARWYPQILQDVLTEYESTKN